MTSWLKNFLRAHLVCEVPAHLARCEFECRGRGLHCTRDPSRQCAASIAHAERLQVVQTPHHA
jgi:hypothetical protein